ncbi:hypothetical protein os1_19550 [Comamonadaceae bacterium OS-1]|nr:hypothetical protein os1_19550 [Comamonadaceae bacterium OS-1]
MATKKATAIAAKTKALSLHMGLNAVSGAAYSGWTGPLAACEFDANDMAAIAKAQGMQPTVLLTKQATRAKFLSALRSAAKSLVAGDLFFLTYSGHGGQVTDIDNDEPDGKDETWCLFDGQILDDELYFEYSKFAAGVRILVLSDSCHSGSVVKALPNEPGSRAMPLGVAMRVYRDHQAFYDKLQVDVAKAAGGQVADPDTALTQVSVSNRLTAVVSQFKPSLVLVSGCQDNQTSMDGDHNGAFTEQVLKVWANGSFKGTYRQFHAKVRAGLPPSQSPNLFTLGKAGKFLQQKPFTV